MSIHFHRQLETARKQILAEATYIQDALSKAVDALMNRDIELAEAVIKGDAEIDQMEVDLEEECLKMIALHQPVANDLRLIVGFLKMNNDLERMGDLVSSIAKRARFLCKHEPFPWPADVESMAANVKGMVRRSIDALISGDVALARDVCQEDDKVDNQKKHIVAAIRKEIEIHSERVPVLLKMLDVPRHLERIADLSTNIAEDVIYMVEGKIVRHRHYDEDVG